MKKIAILALTLFGVMGCQEQQKIAFVDNTELINEYQEKKDIEAKFKEKIEAFQKKTDSMSKAFQLEVQKAQIDAQKMSRANQEKLGLEIQTKGQQLQQQLQLEEQQIAQASQSEIDSLIKKVKSYIKDYGQTNGYSYILGSNEGGSVLYGTEANDLTQTLLDALNSEYKKPE